jgi:hypothetical protein
MLNCIARFLAMLNICSNERLVSVSIQFISHIDIVLNAVFSYSKKLALPQCFLPETSSLGNLLICICNASSLMTMVDLGVGPICCHHLHPSDGAN